jgi:hypothetical protein
MGFTLKIMLMGMTAFATHGGDQLLVLIPDATTPIFASDGSRISVHRPLLVYDCVNTATGLCEKADRSTSAVSALFESWDEFKDDSYGVRELKGVEVSVTPIKTHTTSFAIPELGDMASIAANSEVAKIDPNFLKSVALMTAPYSSLLAGRMSLSGADSVKVTRKVGLLGPIDFDFKPLRGPKGPHSQKLAEEVTIVLEIDATEAKIALTPFRPTTKPDSIMLRPDPAHPFAPVVLRIFNLAICDHWEAGASPGRKECPGDKWLVRQGSEHFELYYELSNSRPPSINRPVPTPKNGGGVTGYDRPICPQVRMVHP